MEINLLMTLIIGFTLGIKHSLEPDHVIAVSTIVSKTKKLWSSCVVGIFWGIGHTLTLFVVGMIFIFMKKEIPVELALTLEFAVGILLVYLGITSFLFPERKNVHSHEHEHNGDVHNHYHSHDKELEHKHSHNKMTHIKSMFIGLVHGLSGSAAMILLTMSTVKNYLQAGIYITIFGIGTVMGMMICTFLIGIPFAASSNNERFNLIFTRVAGLISTAFGLYYMFDLGINEGLFKIWMK
ncbi:sulfite exporter TauE/SafE family protein [Wukongibacter baidiensis]|uniref:urease accessory protein UreH domain-containing protein n=1 Tax=Wukongibacter baidiensis TaxID=1723361 RepID=UPI003D7FC61B